MADKYSSKPMLATQEGYQKVNNFVGIAIFILTFITFFSTMAPSVSFWDCGEYIASCYSLGIPHPPGNPLYVLIGRVFTMVFGFTEQVAFRVNLMSVFAAALTALTLFKIITRALRPVLGEMDESWKSVTALISGTTGALFGVFNYTVWFSAVEASVYIPAVFMVVINVYVALVWAQSKDENRDKYLWLFSYIAFLGIGIHMMSMFALFPVFLFIVLIDRKKLTDWRLWAVALLMGSVIYSMGAFIFIAPFLVALTAVYAFVPRFPAAVINLVLPWVFYIVVRQWVNIEDLNLKNGMELNDFLPFLLMGIFTFAEFVVVLADRAKAEANRFAWHFAFGIVFMAVLGYSVHAYIPIRSALEPMIDENHPVVEFAGSSDMAKYRNAFIESVRTKKGDVLKTYSAYLRELKNDTTLDKLNEELLDAVMYAEYGKPYFDALMTEISKNDKAQKKYNEFLAALDENRSTRALYNRYLSAMNKKKIEWGAFRGFLERKQYGSESMITRMFHRRGAFSRQFGIDGHMGYGGFHVTQFYHFGEDINVDRKGSGADGQDAFKRNNIMYGPLSPKAEAKLIDKSLTADEKDLLAKRMGIGSFDELKAEEKILAVNAVKAAADQMPGVKKYLSGVTAQRNMKRFGILLLYMLPTFFVLFSWGFWFKKDWRMAVLMTTLLLTTSLALVLYMNFADGTRIEGSEYRHWQQQKQMALQRGVAPPPEPRPVHREVRIRDYFYTTGFTFFGMWIGLALAAAMTAMFSAPTGDIKRRLAPIVAVLGLVSPALPFVQNYQLNNRTADWIPYDYAFNLLNSCEKDGILFTNGDNDTFPLWFLQEAEGVRKDVRIVNLSLVNTKWYIKQLKRLEPKVPISYSEREIEYKVNHQRNDFKTSFEYTLKDAGISVMMPSAREKGVLRVQDFMVLNIVDATAWQKPVYFSVTVSPSNLMGLDPYLKQQGMVYRVMPEPVKREDMMDFERTRYLLDKVYRFRHLGDNSTPLSETARKLMNNYAAAFIQFNMALKPELLSLKKEIETMDSQIAALEGDTSVAVDSLASDELLSKEELVAQKAVKEAELAEGVDEVINKFDKCVAIMPWDVRSRKYRHDFLMEFEKFDLAKLRTEEALKIEPMNGLYRSWEAELKKVEMK